MSTKDFIEKAKAVHGDRYAYTNTVYKTAKSKVLVTCETHGDFEITPNNHLSGKRGCPRCYGKVFSIEDFAVKARVVHGDKYDYSRISYKNNITPIEIVCPTHGGFFQKPAPHLRGHGCPECVKRDRWSDKKFIKRAFEVHGDKYDYSTALKSGITSASQKISITCRKHGDFIMKVANHIHSSQGCPKCKIENSDGMYTEKFFQRKKEDIDGYLYVIKLYNSEEKFIKVGITKNIPTSRWRHIKQGTSYSVSGLLVLKMPLVKCFSLEQDILQKYSEKRHTPQEYFGGHTECLSTEVLGEMLIALSAELSDCP